MDLKKLTEPQRRLFFLLMGVEGSSVWAKAIQQWQETQWEYPDNAGFFSLVAQLRSQARDNRAMMEEILKPETVELLLQEPS